MTRRATSSAGFTLLEVLVALAILSIAVVAAIQGFAQGLRLLKLAGDHQEAILIADRKAREVVIPEEGRAEGIEGRFSWQRTTRRLEAPDLAPAGSPPQWRVYEIDVRVRWEGERQVEVATFRTTPASTLPPARSGTKPPPPQASR